MKLFKLLVAIVTLMAIGFTPVFSFANDAPAYQGPREPDIKLNLIPSVSVTLAPAYAGPVTVYEAYDSIPNVMELGAPVANVCNGPDCAGAPQYTYVNAAGQTVTASASGGCATCAASSAIASSNHPVASWLGARPKPFRNFIGKLFHHGSKSGSAGACSAGCNCNR